MVKASPNHFLKKAGSVDYVIWFILLLFSVSTLYPFLNVLFVSFADMKDIVESGGGRYNEDWSAFFAAAAAWKAERLRKGALLLQIYPMSPYNGQ